MRVSERLLKLPEKLRKQVEGQLVKRADTATAVLIATTNRVLSGRRSGRKYRKAGSKRSYRASAPGESPAKRTGQLQGSWSGAKVRYKPYSESLMITKPGITTDMSSLAKILTKGSVRKRGGLLVRRPFKRKVRSRARRQIRQIYRKPYLQG